MSTSTPFFSIVIPTRNRVSLFREALDSVVSQSFSDKEILVVNDGSTGQALEEYRALESEYPGVRFLYLVHRPKGHGQSYSMNYGADNACGKYLCFLDDDDYWTDAGHLQRAFDSLTTSSTDVDVYYTNQDAFLPSGEKVVPNPWIADLSQNLDGLTVDSQGSAEVTPELMFTSRGFAHLNCSVFRREFYLGIGGMDENIRYECDRDIFIRSMDAADQMRLNPSCISYHRVPDPKRSQNMSTTVSIYQKRIYQLNVYEKGCLLSRREVVRKHCLKGKGYQLKHLTEALSAERRYKLALVYAREALGIMPGLKWLGQVVSLTLKSLLTSG